MEKKHESDLDRREKWIIQLNILRSLKGKKRLEYLWDYYKIILAFFLVAVLILCTLGVMIKNCMEDTVLSVVVVDAARTDDMVKEQLEEKILQYVEHTGKYDRVAVDLSVSTAETEENTAKLRVSLSAVSGCDVVVCGEEVYEEYAAQGAFADLETILGKDCEKYQDCITGRKLDLTKCKNQYLIEYIGYSPAYLCVMEHSQHKENAGVMIKGLAGQ